MSTVDLNLSDSDHELLVSVKHKQEIVRSTVELVAEGDVHAAFFFGPGGHGKSHIIKQSLDQTLGVGRWQYSNSSTTPAALVNALQDHSNQIHFLEDMEDLWKKREAQGLLRSACGGPSGGHRIVTWNRALQRRSFEFTGGIIIASNEPLTSHGPLGAIASRFAPIEFVLTPDEIAAMMRSIAIQGMTVKQQHVAPEEALEVAEFLIKEMQSGRHTRADLRTFVEHAIPRYLRYRRNPNGPHWKEMIRSIAQVQPAVQSRALRLIEQRQIASECYSQRGSTEERLALWRDRTGLSKQAFYDRLSEIRKSENLK